MNHVSKNANEAQNAPGVDSSLPAPDVLVSVRGLSKLFPRNGNSLRLISNALLGTNFKVSAKTVIDAVDLDIRAGETIGILGRNGAGKSTLLAMIGGVLPQSAGTVEVRASMAVLLGIGTGFDGAMTGRQNTAMYWTLSGMSKAEIAERMPLAESFADVGSYFDEPMKVYSSGMHARVAFSAAIHRDAQLMIIDETLSVGDADFRLKCHMALANLQAKGRTFLLVSHSDAMVASFCSRAILLEEGKLVFDGKSLDAISKYKEVRLRHEAAKARERNRSGSQDIKSPSDLQSIILEQVAYHEPDDALNNGRGRVALEVRITAQTEVNDPQLGILIRAQTGIVVLATTSTDLDIALTPFERGETRTIRIGFDQILGGGVFFATLMFSTRIGDQREPLAFFDNCLRFDVPMRPEVSGLADPHFDMIEVQSEKEKG